MFLSVIYPISIKAVYRKTNTKQLQTPKKICYNRRKKNYKENRRLRNNDEKANMQKWEFVTKNKNFM